jgi:hypothetical protein
MVTVLGDAERLKLKPAFTCASAAVVERQATKAAVNNMSQIGFKE